MSGIPQDILDDLGNITSATLRKARDIWEHLDRESLEPSHLWGWGPNPEHNSRRALDVMCYRTDGGTGIDRRVGDETVKFLWDMRQEYGLKHLIWRQQIISTTTQPGVWRSMASRGNPTADHYDHVHVLFLDDRYTAPEWGYTGSGGSTAPTPVKRIPGTNNALLRVDGVWGRKTTSALQDLLGTTEDGEVSNQSVWVNRTNPGLKTSEGWEFNNSDRGSDLIREIQRRLKRRSRYSGKIDGNFGPQTRRGLQLHLGLDLPTRSQPITDPSWTVKRLQARANTGKIF